MFVPDSLNLLLLSIPLLFIDWQIALIWGFSVINNPDLIAIYLTYPFGGFEVWVLFLVSGVVRIFLFRGR